MKIEIPGHVYGYHWGNPEAKMEKFYFTSGDAKNTEYAIALCPYTISVELRELPGQNELTQRIVKQLRQEKAEAFASAAREAARIDEKIEKFLAIRNEVA